MMGTNQQLPEIGPAETLKGTEHTYRTISRHLDSKYGQGRNTDVHISNRFLYA